MSAVRKQQTYLRSRASTVVGTRNAEETMKLIEIGSDRGGWIWHVLIVQEMGLISSRQVMKALVMNSIAHNIRPHSRLLGIISFCVAKPVSNVMMALSPLVIRNNLQTALDH